MVWAMSTLEHRIAVVTGATSGIGAATARALSDAGATVVLTGRRADRLDALAAELPRAVAVPADVDDPAPVAAAARELGGADLVVANAGTMMGAPFDEADEAEWDRMIDVNLRGLIRTSRAFTADLLAAAGDGKPADLVLVSSVGAHLRFPGWAVYCATKAGVTHLARNLRTELGPRGVRVKAVEPGIVATELGDDATHATAIAALDEMRTALEPLEPGDIAAAIAFAASAPPRVNVAELVVVPTAQG